MTERRSVKPNKRGARSRELVLDTAERLMAEYGYEGVSVAQIVAEASIPLSSIYHYFGSKDGVLLGVMERGARRFFATMPVMTDLPNMTDLPDGQEARLRFLLGALTTELDRQPDFLRLLTVMTVQPPVASAEQALEVVQRVRATALQLLCRAAAVSFGVDENGPVALTLSRFALSTIDGTILARKSEGIAAEEILANLPTAMTAVHAALTA
ncbi:TetR/AcrR family transcriptional regulator [Rhodococcus gannanensis]|uniref:TetR/AcrR family transcriptional regulator n=1 Tax=Rhodococcus gannanensis TaxID=1960308 RepID=A0ABW4P752_9NOCA